MFNQSAAADARKVLTGKNGMIYDGEGKAMASTESWQISASIGNGNYRPIGTIQAMEYMDNVSFQLTINETVISDARLVSMLEAFKRGETPELNFQSVLRRPIDGQESRIVLRGCVPSGSIDLQNVQVGNAVQRSWTFTINDWPDFADYLK